MFKSFPPLDLPDDVLSFEGEKFFELIQQKCGQVFKELMEILSINTVYKLLLVEDDILPVFQKKYRELVKVTQRACLHLDDGTIMLKPEDSTALVKKVSYNAATNTFGGFATPLEYGIPISGYFKTDSFDELKE
ncbi:unnamed protein product, partial [Rotaria sp. Silwood1]